MGRNDNFFSQHRRNRRSQNTRRNLLLGLSVLVLALLFLTPYLFGKVNEYRKEGTFDQVVRNDTGASQPTTIPAVTQPSATSAAKTAETATETSTTAAETVPATDTLPADAMAAGYQLSTGTPIRILFEKNPDNTVKFLGAADGEGEYTYDVSPDGSKLLINETGAQSLVVIGQTLQAENHSFDSFLHKDRGTLQRQDFAGTGFVWMRNARFFTNDRILFESQVTNEWDRLYIRYLDLLSGTTRVISGSWANEAELLGPVAGGYEVRLNGTVVTITPDLTIVGR